MMRSPGMRLALLSAILLAPAAFAADATPSRTGVGPSSPEKIKQIMAVTNQPGYTEAYTRIAAGMAREAYAMDKQDWPLLVAQYTEDACFETSTDFGELPAEVQKMLDAGVCGHAKIRDYVELASSAGKLKPGAWNQHVYTNFWIERLENDKAWVRGYVAGLGRIEEDYVRGKDGVWLIKRKKIIANSFGSAGRPNSSMRPAEPAAPPVKN
jgi:hypothetical protein